MSKSIPTIDKYMTALPHSVGYDQSIVVAQRMMSEHRIRHLPVLSGGKLLGILTDRDVKLIASIEGAKLDEWKVEEAMTELPYTVTPSAPLDEVASTMAKNKYGSAVIMQGGKVIGIFTTVDACAALTDLLRAG